MQYSSLQNVYPPLFATMTITCGVLYHYPMLKVEWVAGDVLIILSSVGLVNDQICRCRIFAFVQPMGIKGQLR
jgi:hypothetical protein